MSIMGCRIPNACGCNCEVMEDGRSGDGIIVYLFEDEKTMMTVILLKMCDGIKLIGLHTRVHLSDRLGSCRTLIVTFVLQPK